MTVDMYFFLLENIMDNIAIKIVIMVDGSLYLVGVIDWLS